MSKFDVEGIEGYCKRDGWVIITRGRCPVCGDPITR